MSNIFIKVIISTKHIEVNKPSMNELWSITNNIYNPNITKQIYLNN